MTTKIFAGPAGSVPTTDVSEAITDVDISMYQLSQAMGLTTAEINELMKTFTFLEEHLSTKAELMWRLTERANGRDPGKPRLWRGL